ncbi:MAG TPA: NAD-dependent epimerase/dehydratase family protein [bacterium]|nr:NAD-dependent epimerase/dehydratase family protein [bacterium]
MKALVTGGAGFIGSNLVDLLIENDWDVAVIDDLSSGKKENVNPDAVFYEMDIASVEVRDIFEKERPDVLFHFAAQISVSDSVRHPVHDASVNVIGTLNLLEACVEFGVKKFIFSSSGGTVYGEVPGAPAKEDTEFNPESPYGIGKMSMEYYLKFYNSEHGLNFTSLRYGNVYGPRQDPHGEAGVVAIFCTAMLDGRVPTINGDGKCMRDYVYVRDVARANLACVDKGHNKAFNVGTGVTTDVNQIFEALKEATGFEHQAKIGPPRPGDLKRSVLDISLAKEELGWEPEYDLRAGMKPTVEFFKKKAEKK